MVPSVPRQRQESAKELARSASRSLQERLGASQEHPKEAQQLPKSGPKQPKRIPRQLREPIQEQSHDLAGFAFLCTRERDFQGSECPPERSKMALEASVGAFGCAGASGRTGTIDWDRGICRTRASERCGAPVGRGYMTKTGFYRPGPARVLPRKL